jgi:hypothetical protein
VFRSGKSLIGMERGRTQIHIYRAGIECDTSVRTPNTTLAVRGTDVSIFDQAPFLPEARSLTGRAEFIDAIKRVAFGASGRKSRINSAADSPGQLSLQRAIVDPTLPGARTESEQGVVNYLVSQGATTSFDFDAGLAVVRGGSKPDLDSTAFTRSLPGGVNFVLSWTGGADLNLFAFPSVPQTSTVGPTPGNTIDPSSGGRSLFDHRGGGSGGVEIVNYPRTFIGQNSNSFIGFGFTYVNGSKPANYDFDVVVNGVKLAPDTNDHKSGTIKPGEAKAHVVDLEPIAEQLTSPSPSIVRTSGAGRRVKP